MKICFGTVFNKIDVTDVCYEKLLDGNIITIPMDDVARAAIFSDPVYGVKKKYLSN